MTAAALRRLPDWPRRLDAYVDAHLDRAFAWGDHDCARFAAGAVQAITGTMPPLPDWANHRQALRLLQQPGGLQALVGAVLPALSGAAHARRGDLLLVPVPMQPDGPALAVCLGHLWAAPGPHALNYGKPAQALAAWKVG